MVDDKKISSKLLKRKIGDTSVSAIGYGAMGLSAFYDKPQSDEDRFKILDALYERGCTFWDTANVYNDSEYLIGKWLKRTGKRQDIFLATKVGWTTDQDRQVNGDPEYIKRQFEKSIRRLGVGYVDLYYLHRADPLVPIERTIGTMSDLVRAGTVRYIGLSEVSSTTLRRAHAIHPISALQVEYSPFTLDVEDPNIGLLATARELGITVVAYSPLGRGLVTGLYRSPDDFDDDDFRRIIPRYSSANFPKILKVAEGLKVIGAQHGATGAQVALAWLLAQGPDIIPIPGTTNLEHLEENPGAATLKLSKEEVEAVRGVAKEADAGNVPRYPDEMMKYMFVDTPQLASVPSFS